MTTEAPKRQKMCSPDEGLASLSQDIWIHKILPFVGMGHYAFVAPVSKQMKQYYRAYCDPVVDLPLVKVGAYGATEPATNVATFYSAVFSSVACFKFWDSQGSRNITGVYDIDPCALIAKTGNLLVLKWAYQKNVSWDATTCSAAAGRGHVEILMYAHRMGCPWDSDTCAQAAYGGHLHILKFARDRGCPWNATTCYGAAENGCPWDKDTCKAAAIGGHLEIVKYCHENGCRWDSISTVPERTEAARSD